MADKTTADHPGVLIHPPLLFVAALALAGLLEWLWPLSFGELGDGVLIAGGMFIAAALLLAGWAVLTLHRGGTSIPTHRPSHAIVTSGPFARVRNPIYIALLALQLGLALLLDSPWLLGLLVPAWGLLRWGVVAREERYLQRKFGAAYLDYKAAVRRGL